MLCVDHVRPLHRPILCHVCPWPTVSFHGGRLQYPTRSLPRQGPYPLFVQESSPPILVKHMCTPIRHDRTKALGSSVNRGKPPPVFFSDRLEAKRGNRFPQERLGGG